MKKVFISLAILCLIWACGNSDEKKAPSQKEDKTIAEAKPKKIDGKKVYKQYCVTCHGLYGDMGASGAYNLQTSELSIEERMHVIKNGRNTMAALGNLLKDEQIKAVAEYTLTLKTE